MANSRIICIRIEPMLLSQIDAVVAKKNKTRKKEKWTRGSWIKVACDEKLAHLFRSSKKKKAESLGCITPPAEEEKGGVIHHRDEGTN